MVIYRMVKKNSEIKNLPYTTIIEGGRKEDCSTRTELS
jgi:hypothetical protein